MRRFTLAWAFLAALAMVGGQAGSARAQACLASTYGGVQAAIDASTGGSWDCFAITLDSGTTFYESVTVGRDLILASDGTAVLDGSGTGASVITVQSGAVLSLIKFTLRDGQTTNGGCLYNEGETRLYSMTLEDCEADVEGGGIWSSGVVSMENTTIERCVAQGLGGGILSTGDLSILDSEITDNEGYYVGGVAIDGTASIDSSEITDNGAFYYAGLLNVGTTDITHTEISGNFAVQIPPYYTGFAGGIMNDEDGHLSISHSTIAENTADLAVGGILHSGDYMHVSNSTISSNHGYTLGGVYVWGGGGYFVNTTVFENTSDDYTYANGIYADASDPATAVELLSTIIADNDAADCNGVAAMVSFGHNLDSDNTCNLVNVGDRPNEIAVNLYPLGNYGGKTRTHLPKRTSPAVDNANTLICLFMSGDQRDKSRIVGGACDIGAVERQQLELIPIHGDPPFGPGLQD